MFLAVQLKLFSFDWIELNFNAVTILLVSGPVQEVPT